MVVTRRQAYLATSAAAAKSTNNLNHQSKYYCGSVGSDHLSSLSDDFVATGFRPKVQTKFPVTSGPFPANFEMETVTEMIDLG
ncbi:unnamed protein product [Adineta ricciae]|uniref:Uncharacterized protein n=1 Tax=Adineta ricciae TaxID=249248 RepID=A0A816AIL2_ADIRI|nr:unnamed protein product [Adineta ricciae]